MDEFLLIEAAKGGDGKSEAKVVGLAYGGGKMTLVGWPVPVVVDLAGLRFASRVPLLTNHENKTSARVGMVVPKIEGDALEIEGDIVSTGGLATGIIEQSKAGADWQLSIGAEVLSSERISSDDDPVMINGREFYGPFYWIKEARLREVSVVAVGADESTRMSVAASFRLTGKGDVMDKDKQGGKPTTKDKDKTPDVKATSQGPQAPKPGMDSGKDLKSAAAEAIQAERQRVATIRQLCAGEFKELEAKAIDEGWDETRTSQAVLEAMRAARPQAPAGIVKDTQKDTQVLEAALSLRAGIDEDTLVKDHGEKVVEAAEKDRGISLQQLIAECARMEGISVPRTFGNDTIRAGFSTVSLSDILGNVANKRLLRSFEAQPIVATKLCAASDLADFKEAERYRLSDVGDLEQVAPDGEIKHGTLADEKATNQLATYGKMLALTRQMIFNDDLGAFLKVPDAMGARAARLIDHLFFTRLLANPGSPPLFSSAHKNTQSGADTALDADALGDALQLFLDQTDIDGQPINVAPKFLLVPTSLKFAAKQLLNSSYFTATGDTDAKNIATANPYAGEDLVVISSPYLNNANYTGYSSVGWYLFGDPAVVDTFEIGYLRGRRTPTVEKADTDFNTLGIQYRVYFDLGVREMDYRGMVFSKGEA